MLNVCETNLFYFNTHLIKAATAVTLNNSQNSAPFNISTKNFIKEGHFWWKYAAEIVTELTNATSMISV